MDMHNCQHAPMLFAASSASLLCYILQNERPAPSFGYQAVEYALQCTSLSPSHSLGPAVNEPLQTPEVSAPGYRSSHRNGFHEGLWRGRMEGGPWHRPLARKVPKPVQPESPGGRGLPAGRALKRPADGPFRTPPDPPPPPSTRMAHRVKTHTKRFKNMRCKCF